MGQVYAGRYELVDHIGGGGSGHVWRAWDHRHRRYLAVKVLQQRDAGAVIRFVREQSLRVAHPHVLPPIGFAADDDVVLLTMELAAGGSLGALVKAVGPLPLRYVVVLLDQLLDALGAVHAAAVVHRDIKPANLLLDPVGLGRPRLRLADFGIAIQGDEVRLTEQGYLAGTPAYLPPELTTGVSPEPRHDLYAAGAVAWYLLVGRHPLHGADLAAELPPGLPSAIGAVFATLLAADPARRYPSAAVARAALAGAVTADGLASVVAAVGTPADREQPIPMPARIGPLPPGWTEAGPLGPFSPTGRFHPEASVPPGTLAGGRGSYEWSTEQLGRASDDHASTEPLPAPPREWTPPEPARPFPLSPPVAPQATAPQPFTAGYPRVEPATRVVPPAPAATPVISGPRMAVAASLVLIALVLFAVAFLR